MIQSLNLCILSLSHFLEYNNSSILLCSIIETATENINTIQNASIRLKSLFSTTSSAEIRIFVSFLDVYGYDYVNWYKHNSYIFIKITHVIRLTHARTRTLNKSTKREVDVFDEDTLSFQFNSIQFGRHICLHAFAFPSPESLLLLYILCCKLRILA